MADTLAAETALRLSPLRSIRARLTAAVTLVVAALLIAADLGLMAYSRRDAGERADRSLAEARSTVEASLRNETVEAQEFRDRDDKEKSAPPRAVLSFPARSKLPVPSLNDMPAAEALRETQVALEGDEVAVLVRDSRGNFWESQGASALHDPAAASRRWRLRREDNLRVGNTTYSIVLGTPWAATEASLMAQARLLALLTLFALPITAAGAWLLVGGTLRPIDLLARQAREKGGQRQSESDALARPHLDPPSADAEVVGLVATLNDLLDSAVETAESRGRFYTAASHELRTPLQILAGRVELTLSRERTADEYRASLVEVQEQTDRLVSLVQSLLLLNRIERSGGQPIEVKHECADLLDICHSQTEALRTQITHRDLEWRQDVDEALSRTRIPAISASHAEILLRNLMENAARYTPQGGKVHLVLRESEDRSALIVELSNDAVPLPESDMARLAEPFYRPDPSRNVETGGNGLGLTICRAIADLNHWSFSLAQRDGQMKASVAFPKEKP